MARAGAAEDVLADRGQNPAEAAVVAAARGAGLAAGVSGQAVLGLLRDGGRHRVVRVRGRRLVRQPVAELLVVDPVVAQRQVEHRERRVAGHVLA